MLESPQVCGRKLWNSPRKESAVLVLTRKVNESIEIGNDITVTITQIKGGRIRIGIEAPDNIRIMRSELSEEPEADTPATSVLA